MASSASGQDESNPALWLGTRAGKMDLSRPLIADLHAVVIWLQVPEYFSFRWFFVIQILNSQRDLNNSCPN